MSRNTLQERTAEWRNRHGRATGGVHDPVPLSNLETPRAVGQTRPKTDKTEIQEWVQELKNISSAGGLDSEVQPAPSILTRLRKVTALQPKSTMSNHMTVGLVGTRGADLSEPACTSEIEKLWSTAGFMKESWDTLP